MRARAALVGSVASFAAFALVFVATQSVSTRSAHAFMRPSSMQRSGCGSGMASIPGGAYDLGEAKRHATVEAFCLDVHEVTVADYDACVARGVCKFDTALEKKYDTCNHGRADRRDHPLNCVNWYEADAYCTAVGKRLPSEDEWEWAARGGSKALTYSWGEDAKNDEGWCWRNNRTAASRWPNSTCPVMQFPPNVFGVYDLSGDLWEWTSTLRADGSSLTGVTEGFYVFRGGSWGSTDVIQARADIRGGDGASWRDPDVGFRCAKSRR
jgi:formylglycine-generating enzyme required for sulfatase activity